MIRAATSATLIGLLMLSGCIDVPTAEEAGISYPTQAIAWPEQVECLNSDTPGLAKEVLIGKTRTIVVAGGDDPISDADWEDFKPGLGNQKNSDRNLQFESSCFARSPYAPANCRGDACRSVVELKGHTWIELSAVEAIDCIPADAKGCGIEGVPPGALMVTVTRKCHEIVFTGAAWFLVGPAGELAVMHATEAAEPTDEVTLPPGWRLEQRTLAEPLVVHPFGTGDDCYYNIIRDHRVQAYHQIGFAGPTYP